MMMKRRIGYYLAAAGLVAAGIAGALSGGATPSLAKQQYMDEVEFDLAGFKTRSGGTEVSIFYQSAPHSNQVLAGFNSTKMGTEVAY
jgi:hypothetical protein